MNSNFRNVDLSQKQNQLAGKIGYSGGSGIGSYSNTYKGGMNTGGYGMGGYGSSMNRNSKYSQNELDEAKNSTKGLGIKPLGYSGVQTTGSDSNYRKAFKPDFGNNNKIGTGGLSNTLNTKKPQFGNNYGNEENFIVEKPKISSGIGGHNKLNFASKYNTGSNTGIYTNMNQQQPYSSQSNRTGSYTNSKLNKGGGNMFVNNTPSYQNSTNNNSNNVKSNTKFTNVNNKGIQDSNYSYKKDIDDPVDNRVAMNTRR